MKLFAISLLILSHVSFAQTNKVSCEDSMFDVMATKNSPVMRKIDSLELEADKAEDAGDKVTEKKLRSKMQSIQESVLKHAFQICKDLQ